MPVLANWMMNAWIGNGHEGAMGSIRWPLAMPCWNSAIDDLRL